MSEQISEPILKSNFELYSRIHNDKRKDLLIFIYDQPRNYTQLIEFSLLKPGSLYHHLNTLIPLIEKQAHGLYVITKLGREIVENLNLVDLNNKKPSVAKENIQEDDLNIIGDENDSTNKVSEKTAEVTSSTDLLAVIWLGNSSLFLIGFILTIVVLLGFQGISLAGSAVYSVGNNIAFMFDIMAFAIGFASLYYLEMLQVKHSVYNKMKFIITIRFLSMMPGVIIGISLLLLHLSGIIPATNLYPWIFSLTITLGTLVAAAGIYYLRSLPFNQALLFAIVPGMIDLLLGVIVLIVNS
ncbi:MAG: hypothetical protein ACXAD7_10565 [Candidatus Kariarchaeaceae archaeon]